MSNADKNNGDNSRRKNVPQEESKTTPSLLVSAGLNDLDAQILQNQVYGWGKKNMTKSQTTIPWKPISEYKGGDALFYYPEIKNSPHASNDRPAICDFGHPWVNRRPSHFAYVFPPEAE